MVRYDLRIVQLEPAVKMCRVKNSWNDLRVFFADDVQPFQWLIAEDGSIKLNDFNRAEFMLYDEEHKQYCKYKNGVGPGDVSIMNLLVRFSLLSFRFACVAYSPLAVPCSGRIPRQTTG